MRKFLPVLLLFIAVVLSACLPETQATPAVTATATTSSRPAAALVTLPAQAALPDQGCTAVTKKPTAGPTSESNFPPVTTSDWVKGPADAKVTIIEYSDFQ
jgi:hypothetical protein